MDRPETNPWIERFSRPPADPALRLFCLPFAGGAAQSYRGWANEMDPSIDVCPIQPPGRWKRHREEPLTSIEQMVEALAIGLEDELERPFAFYGHSLGGIVAFELARFFRAAAKPLPRCLFIAAHRAAQSPIVSAPTHRLPADDFERAVCQRFPGGIPEAVRQDRELMEMMLPTLRADLQIYETYRYKPAKPLECPIIAMAGSNDTFAPASELAPWREQTTSRFRLETFPGGHFFHQECQREVIRVIEEELLHQPAPHFTAE